jgi:hypothetical protein
MLTIDQRLVTEESEDGTPLYKYLECEDGTVYYFNLSHQLHFEDGPAISYWDGGQIYMQNGARHREDGPAVIYPDDHKENLWYLWGKETSEREVMVGNTRKENR